MRACTLAAQKEDEDGTGFSHTLTSLHESYLERFEATCEWAIEVEGGDPKEFFAACQRVTSGGPATGRLTDFPEELMWFVDALLAAMDFRVFLTIMREKAEVASRSKVGK